ncbi:hypothetical protein CYMTET_50551 [Cymbomonas tetramitiformis]|uniref:3-hydroxyisobutyrate dehydrogenase n=1 Tax=Cymbomonas tetramitiformis TaxID=36881 RepID=A0AAE0BMW4_9CHLO|nr:hypothetical protein CYMTET_50551 [Cymbomonas tetramitiformis]
MATALQVAVVGVGNMGSQLATRLMRAGFHCNLVASHQAEAQELARSLNAIRTRTCGKVSAAESIQSGLQGASLVLSCLPNRAVVTSVVAAAMKSSNLMPGTVWVDATSSDPKTSRDLASVLQKDNVTFMDCAVSGGPAGAAKGTLTAMIGGYREAQAASADIALSAIRSFAHHVVHTGPVGSGHAVKAVNNALLATNLWATSEGLALLSREGVDPAAALSAINYSSGRSWVGIQRFPDHILNGRFDYGFALDLLAKDVRTAVGLAGSQGATSLPVLSHIQELTERAALDLGSNADHTCIAHSVERSMGVTLRSSGGILPPPTKKGFSSAAGGVTRILPEGIEMCVFDMAGTVIDEGGIVYDTLKEVMRGDGLVFTEAEFDAWHGANKEEVIAHFVKLAGDGDGATQDTRTARLYALFQERIKDAYFNSVGKIAAIDGAPEVFVALRKHGIKVCLNTGYPRDIADGLISRMGYADLIDASTCAEEVGMGRPAPYMIHSLMRKTGVMRASGVAKFGDTQRDMEEGVNAGVGVKIGVLSGADNEETLMKSGATLVVPSVKSLLEELK